MRKNREIIILLSIVLWAAAIIGGFRVLFTYANKEGQSSLIRGWPADTNLPPLSSQPRLVVFLHPDCPCSRATLAELDGILANTKSLPEIFTVFVATAGFPEAKIRGSLWKRAEAIPGAHVILDRGGREAKKFGAHTSGQVLAYDQKGKLGFSGGITPARGHQGESVGRSSLEAFLAGAPSGALAAKVFGCSLFEVSARELVTN